MVPASIANVTTRERKLSRIFTEILHKDGGAYSIQWLQASHLPKKKRSFGTVRPLENSGAVSEEVSLRRRAIRRTRIGYLSSVNTAKPVRNSPGIGGAKSTSEQNLLAIQPTFTDKA